MSDALQPSQVAAVRDFMQASIERDERLLAANPPEMLPGSREGLTKGLAVFKSRLAEKVSIERAAVRVCNEWFDARAEKQRSPRGGT